MSTSIALSTRTAVVALSVNIFILVVGRMGVWVAVDVGIVRVDLTLGQLDDGIQDLADDRLRGYVEP